MNLYKCLREHKGFVQDHYGRFATCLASSRPIEAYKAKCNCEGALPAKNQDVGKGKKCFQKNQVASSKYSKSIQA